MGRYVPVTLFETLVLPLVVKVIAAHNDSASHLGGDDNPAKHAPTHRNIASEGTFLVDVGAVNSLTRRLIAATHRKGRPKLVPDRKIPKSLALSRSDPDFDVHFLVAAQSGAGAQYLTKCFPLTLIPSPTLRYHLPLFRPTLPTKETAPCLRKAFS
jgi:hypothetical protein